MNQLLIAPRSLLKALGSLRVLLLLQFLLQLLRQCAFFGQFDLQVLKDPLQGFVQGEGLGLLLELGPQCLHLLLGLLFRLGKLLQLLSGARRFLGFVGHFLRHQLHLQLQLLHFEQLSVIYREYLLAEF